MRHVTRAVIVLVCLISSVDTVSAQTVTGTIRDETGAVLSNVVVEAVPAANGPGTQVVTGENGSYELWLPSAGRFDLSFRRTGFADHHRSRSRRPRAHLLGAHARIAVDAA